MKAVGVWRLSLLIGCVMMMTISTAVSQVPEMGGDNRPNYEVYKMERLIGHSNHDRSWAART
jgi:hypothetical protein